MSKVRKMKRILYLACYDIVSPRRLVKCLNLLRSYASGKQYSCFECYLSLQEQKEMMQKVNELTTNEDAFALIKLNRSKTIHTLGQGETPQDELFMWVG